MSGANITLRVKYVTLVTIPLLAFFALLIPMPARGAPQAAAGTGSTAVSTITVGTITGDPAQAPMAKRWCATGVYRSGTASCPFAINVADAWFASGGARRLYGVYSPATGLSYNLKCTYYRSKGYAKCQTGRAVVYVYSSAQAIDCGNDIWVSGNADCGFAGNVADEYYNSGGDSRLYNVYWPTYDEYYDVSCKGYNPVTCWVTGSYVYIY